MTVPARAMTIPLRVMTIVAPVMPSLARVVAIPAAAMTMTTRGMCLPACEWHAGASVELLRAPLWQRMRRPMASTRRMWHPARRRAGSVRAVWHRTRRGRTFSRGAMCQTERVWHFRGPVWHRCAQSMCQIQARRASFANVICQSTRAMCQLGSIRCQVTLTRCPGAVEMPGDAETMTSGGVAGATCPMPLTLLRSSRGACGVVSFRDRRHGRIRFRSCFRARLLDEHHGPERCGTRERRHDVGGRRPGSRRYRQPERRVASRVEVRLERATRRRRDDGPPPRAKRTGPPVSGGRRASQRVLRIGSQSGDGVRRGSDVALHSVSLRGADVPRSHLVLSP